MHHAMRRQLGSFEHAWVLTGLCAPLAVVSVLRVRNGPSRESLRRALNELQSSQPMLRVSIVAKGRQFWFESPSSVPEIPLELIERQDEDHWRRVAVQALNSGVDITSAPLMYCIYLRQPAPGSEAELVLVYHHAIMDAAAGITLFHSLLSLCAGKYSEEGKAAKAMLPPAEKSFPRQQRGPRLLGSILIYLLRQMVDEIQYRRRLRHGWRQPIHPDARCDVLSGELDEDITRQLFHKSRRERVSMPNILATAMLLAVQRHLYRGKATPARMMSFASLRPYLRPPVADEYLGFYAGMVRHTVYLPQALDFWRVARSVQEKSTKSGRRGEKYAGSVLSKQMIKMLVRFQAFRLATIALSYPAVVTLEPAYGDIQITGLHAYISNFRLGPEYAAVGKLFQGRLSWDLLYLDSDMDRVMAEKIAEEITQLLTDAV